MKDRGLVALILLAAIVGGLYVVILWRWLQAGG